MNRMFQVIVVGGIALTADACGTGATVADHASSASGGSGSSGSSGTGVTLAGSGGSLAFPHEGAAPASSTVASSSGFPPLMTDAGSLVDAAGGGDAAADVWSFPGEAQ
jgi:hypothetical protein